MRIPWRLLSRAGLGWSLSSVGCGREDEGEADSGAEGQCTGVDDCDDTNTCGDGATCVNGSCVRVGIVVVKVVFVARKSAKWRT